MKTLWMISLAVVASATVVAGADTRTSDLISEKRSTEEWTKEPTTYRDIPFGASEADVAAKLGKLKCRGGYLEPTPHRSCSLTDKAARLHIGDAVMSESFDFIGGQFARVEIRNGGGASTWGTPAATAPLPAVRDAFVNRYGEPTIDQTFRVKGTRDITNRYGGLLAVEPYEVKRSLLTWEGRNVRVIVGGEIDSTELYVASIAGPQWLEAERDAAKKKATTNF